MRFSPALATIALLTLGASAAEPCTLVVTARAGDTCASLSEISGITVSQFLRANPGITTCGNLAPGTRYCVDPNYAVSTTSRAPAATNQPGAGSGSSALNVTINGQCGDGLTCLGSAFGDCCSNHGWCGSTADHCGADCQATFGRCGSSGGSSGGSAIAQPTGAQPTAAQPTGGNVAVTATVYVTKTITAPALATATQIVRQTVSVTVKENNGVATATSTVLVTQSSITFISSTVTTIKTVTITDAKQCTARSVNSPVVEPSAPAVAGVVPREAEAIGVARVTAVDLPKQVMTHPSPTQPGTVPDCQTFYRIKGTDSCEDIVHRHAGAFGMQELYAWNQQLTGDCQGLWLGHWICVGV